MLFNPNLVMAGDAKLTPVYAQFDATLMGYGFAPIGADLGETWEDIPCIKDSDNNDEYVCAQREFILLRSQDNKCIMYLYNNLFEDYNFNNKNVYKNFSKKNGWVVKKGQVIGYIEKGSNIEPKIVNTCNKK